MRNVLRNATVVPQVNHCLHDSSRVLEFHDAILPPTLRDDSTTLIFSAELTHVPGVAVGAPILLPPSSGDPRGGVPHTWLPFGHFLRVSDDGFLSAILRLPLSSIATPAALVREKLRKCDCIVITIVRPHRCNFPPQAALLSPSSAWAEAASRLAPVDLRVPTPCDARLLPTLSRPSFEDYFRGVTRRAEEASSSQPAAPRAGQKRQRELDVPAGPAAAPPAASTARPPVHARRVWPTTYQEYYYTMSTLLLEEARAALAAGVLTVSACFM